MAVFSFDISITWISITWLATAAMLIVLALGVALYVRERRRRGGFDEFD